MENSDFFLSTFFLQPYVPKLIEDEVMTSPLPPHNCIRTACFLYQQKEKVREVRRIFRIGQKMKMCLPHALSRFSSPQKEVRDG